MTKNKLTKFSEIGTFQHVVEPSILDLKKDISLKGNWRDLFFKNNNPIILELGCGKGEYTVALARKYPNNNFIGIDIKGNRIWKGASESLNMNNVGFLRIRIENIEKCFDRNEVDEMWITFPDPQIKRRRSSKRLTHPDFLKKYYTFLSKQAVIHLKTDSQFLYGYTLGVIQCENHELIKCTNDLYNFDDFLENTDIKTYYEELFLKKEMPITYISFRIKY